MYHTCDLMGGLRPRDPAAAGGDTVGEAASPARELHRSARAAICQNQRHCRESGFPITTTVCQDRLGTETLVR